MKEKVEEGIFDIKIALDNEFDKAIKSRDLGLLSTLGGYCIFYYNFARFFNDIEAEEKAFTVLERIIELAENAPLYSEYTFCNGLAGVGWLINYLKLENFIDLEDEDILKEFDECLAPVMFQELEKGNYDYLHGAMGIYLYYLSRYNEKNNFEILTKASVILEKISKQCDTGVYWENFSVTNMQKDVGIANLGLSHGIPSIITLLSKFNLLDSEKRFENLIQGGCDFMISTQNPSSQNSLYPYNFDVNLPLPNSSRLGWCYGDLGIASTLLISAESLDDHFLKKKAFEIIKHAQSRIDLVKNNIVDGGLCHGTSGIGHMFKNFYFRTGDKTLLETSNMWYLETIDLVKPKAQLATGYCKWENKNGYMNCYGLLEGISGVGLALLSSLTQKQAKWDECLLLS